MTAKDLIRSLKSNLETASQVSENPIVVLTDAAGKIAKATVAIEIEGKVRLIEVLAKDLGDFDGLTIEGTQMLSLA